MVLAISGYWYRLIFDIGRVTEVGDKGLGRYPDRS